MARQHVVTLAVVGLAVAGCAAPSADDPPADISGADVVVVAEDMAFRDPPQELDAGEIALALDNQGSAPHDVTFEGGPGTVVSAQGGQRDVADVTLDAGTYTVYCSVPGHRQAGMEFEVAVE